MDSQSLLLKKPHLKMMEQVIYGIIYRNGLSLFTILISILRTSDYHYFLLLCLHINLIFCNIFFFHLFVCRSFCFIIIEGWINPTNIQKYRAGAHISMVQFDKPTGRGNSGVHLDYKESPLLAANMLRSNGSFSRSNTDSAANSVCGAATGTGTPSDTKSMTSRQSNYKNVPTDPLRSMASMMMMGKNTITTSIPLENWKDLKFSKTSSQTFFSTAGKTVNSDDFITDSKVLTETDDSVTNAINSTQHLSISNNNKRSKSNKNEVYSMKSACVTTDFSMQNVLMQMGLNVISVDGMLIRYVFY